MADGGVCNNTLVKSLGQHKDIELILEKNKAVNDAYAFGMLESFDPMSMIMGGLMGSGLMMGMHDDDDDDPIFGGGDSEQLYEEMEDALARYKKIQGDAPRYGKSINKILPPVVLSASGGWPEESEPKIIADYLQAGGLFIYSQDINQSILDAVGVGHWKKGGTHSSANKITLYPGIFSKH